MTMHSKTKGSSTATRFTTDQEMEMTGAHPMSQKVHSEGRHIGACDGAERSSAGPEWRYSARRPAMPHIKL